jgi:hypothetical protein
LLDKCGGFAFASHFYEGFDVAFGAAAGKLAVLLEEVEVGDGVAQGAGEILGFADDDVELRADRGADDAQCEAEAAAEQAATGAADAAADCRAKPLAK